MKLHQKRLQRDLARAVAPSLSHAIFFLGATNPIRKLVAFMNYLLGRGSGMGWALESEVAAAINCIKRADPIVFDVGANIGEWSRHYRELTGSGLLFMFEPQPACQDAIISKNIINSQLVRSAVGNQTGAMKLYTSSPTDGSASLHERHDSFFDELTYEAIDVEVLSLDDFIKQQNLDFIDFIKFDIEGHELDALKGLMKALTAGKIGALSFEFGSGNLNSGTCFRDFWKLLHKQYHISVITPSGRLREITSYYEDEEFYRGVSNFIAELKRR